MTRPDGMDAVPWAGLGRRRAGALALLALAVLVGHLALLQALATAPEPRRLGPAGPAPALQVRLLAEAGIAAGPRPAAAFATRSAASPLAVPVPVPLLRSGSAAPRSPARVAQAATTAGAVRPPWEAAAQVHAQGQEQALPAEPAAATPPRPAAPPAAAPQDALDGGADGAPAADGPPPFYPTRLPPPVRLTYQLRYLGRPAQATLHWQHDGQHFMLQFDAGGPDRVSIRQRSEGRLDAAGLAPERHLDRRAGRGARAASIDHAAGLVRYSASTALQPAWPGTQDRLSWLPQLVAIVRAAAEGGQPLPEVVLHVVDVRGGAALLRFLPQGEVAVAGASGAVTAQHWLHEPARPDGLRIEAWLAPALGLWPVRLRQTLPRSGASIEWRLEAPP